jgi:hypothetical protein
MELCVFRCCLNNSFQYLIRLFLKLGEVCDKNKEMQMCLHFYIYIYDMMFIQMYNYQYVCMYLLIVIIWICWCLFIFILLNAYICICKLDPFYWVLLFVHASQFNLLLKRRKKKKPKKTMKWKKMIKSTQCKKRNKMKCEWSRNTKK